MAYLTGDNPGSATLCRVLLIPDDLYLLMAVNGALLELTNPANWEESGDLSPEEAATLMQTMFDSYVESDCS